MPTIAGTLPFAIAQGNSGTTRDHALAAYASGNARLRRGDLAAASRDLDRAIANEKQFFATLGSEQREGESSYLIEYLTLAGVADHGLGRHALAFVRWTAAHELYARYLPRLNQRFGAADALVAQHRCGEAFRVYTSVFVPREPAVLAVLRAGQSARWAEARAADATIRGTPSGDYFAGVIASCTHAPRQALEHDLVAALADYAPTSSETPNVGPLQASTIRLLGRRSVH